MTIENLQLKSKESKSRGKHLNFLWSESIFKDNVCTNIPDGKYKTNKK